jgi:glycerol-3-phosphate cytidylyltransferase
MARKKIVYTGGTFDLFHRGHVNFLRQAKKLGDFLVVSLNTDEFCEEYKRKPVMTYEERRDALKSCRYVDAVIKNTGGKDSKPPILEVGPDIIVHGDDWKYESYMRQLGIDKTFLKENKIKLAYIPYTKNISTSEIIKRILK